MRVVDASRGSVVRSHRRAMSCQISSTQVVDASRGSVVRSHRRAMRCQISSIFSTRLVDPSRTSVVRSHSKVMHGPCRPPQQVSAYAPPPPPPARSKHLVGPSRSPRRVHTSCAASGSLAPVDSHTQRTRLARGDGRGTVGPTPWGHHLNHAKRPEFPAKEQQTRVPGCIPSPKPRRSTL